MTDYGYGGDNGLEVKMRGGRDGKKIDKALFDKDQMRKFEETIELLLAAGYFRARIKGLSAFDKVIGGLAWCITSSNVDVDIDIFFQENAQIGQKILLGENIERALIRMRCPHPLQSFQIQGLDCISMFPVIQWLVKKVIETREETGDMLRVHAESLFDSNYTMPQDAQRMENLPGASLFATDVSARYRARRRFRQDGAQDDEESRVQCTLLEYGQRPVFYQPLSMKKNDGSSRKLGDAASKVASALGGKPDASSSEKEARAKAAYQKRLEGLMKGLDSVDGSGRVSVGDILDTDQISQYHTEYDASREGMDDETQRVYGEEAHTRRMERGKKQLAAQEEAVAQVRAEHEAVSERLKEVQAKYEKVTALNERIKDEIEKLNALETPENAKDLAQLRQLVALNESLKRQESQFRANCKQQLQDLKAKTQKLQNAEPDEEELQRKRLVQETFDKDFAKLEKIRQAAAKKARDCALVERKIDEFPSRTELQQYQRMFVELYEQVHAKHLETRMYYTSYNALDDARSFLQSEVNILNSVHDNFEVAMKSNTNKENLLTSLQSSMGNLAKNLTTLENKLGGIQKEVDELNGTYLSLVEKERTYFKATKDFEEECRKNGILLSKLGL